MDSIYNYCKGYHMYSTVRVPQLHLNGLFSSSLWTLCTLLLQPLQALCTSAAPVLQFSVYSVYSSYYCNLSRHCVPQLHMKGLFSSSLWTRSVYSITAACNLCKHCVPQLHAPERLFSSSLWTLCTLRLYCKGYHSSQTVDSVYYLSCT